ncbi:ATP-binding protein [Colwellia sp. UCD-KL20]|uniref:ATP-binding protein n=1 Tax=Colwellia sp. UCD-KL20 TaxID=1917165 RepID=UPI000970CA9F|nr:ATP-binding protein [Colwellia sp. UCD-KL20]
MNRLFINLYVVIICGLLAINLVSEKLWSFYANESDEIVKSQHFIELLPHLISPSERDIQLVSSSLKVPVSVISISDVAWLDEQLNQLNLGHSVAQYNEQDDVVFYAKVANQERLYQIGPFVNQQISSADVYIKWIILAFSYLLLAGVVAIWIKPLWRDLHQLNAMAAAIADGEHEVKLVPHSISPINHIVLTFYQMAHRIKRLLSDQKHLVNAVSHELRTPLSRLRFALALLPAEDKLAVKEMEKDIKEIETLIDEMLGYARLENVNQQIEKSSVDLSALVNQQLSKLVFVRSLNIRKNIPTSLFYVCNAKLIERVIQNLLVNATRYANNTINISLETDTTKLHLVIEDDGVGIAENEASKVFKPFYRLESLSDNSETSSGAGFGLGLAIVKRICDWHLAICKVERSSLGGCKFILSFPYHQ